LDFNDLHIDREGRAYIAFADGCTGECAELDKPMPEDSRTRRGAVYYLGNGPSLYDGLVLSELYTEPEASVPQNIERTIQATYSTTATSGIEE